MTVETYHGKVKPIHDHIIVKGMEFSERISTGGIIIPSDNTKSEGIRPRWGEVIAVGPEQEDIKVGQYVLVEHGRWTRGIKMDDGDGNEIMIRRIDPACMLLVSDEPQNDETWSEAVSAQSDLNRIHGSLHNDGISETYK